LSNSFPLVDVTVADAEPREEVERITGAAGLVVDLTRGGRIHPQGRQTVFRIRHGATAAASRAALVREFLAHRATVTTTVSAARSGEGEAVVAAARTSLSRRSLAESRKRARAKIPSLLVRGLAAADGGGAPVTLTADDGGIGAADVAVGAARLVGGLARSAAASLMTNENYEVAWGARRASDSPFALPTSMQWVDHPPDRFLADPFLARDNGKTFVFVEDYSRRDRYASIAVFEPHDPRGSFRTVLDRGTHMSYPLVFRDAESGEWLMLPETATEGRITLFRAAHFPDVWHEDTVLLDGVSAFDPTILFRDGRYWLFYATGTPGSTLDDELHLVSSATLRGPYVEHPWSPLKSDVIGSRPAGRLFDWQGRLIRPAQDSSTEYGYAVVFQEVTELTPTRYAERPVGRLDPDWAPGLRGTHSWDFLDDIVVADAKRARRRHGTLRVRRERAR
jgi:hypothetical protein